MRRAFLALLGATSLALAGCGAEADKGASIDGPEDIGVSEDVGVSMSGLTNCVRTELSNGVGGCGGLGYFCYVRFMQNNFVCSEGVVGQASTEILTATGYTATVVATLLFGQHQAGYQANLNATIAAQWGHTYASTHVTYCEDEYVVGNWNMNPWTRQPVPEPAGRHCN